MNDKITFPRLATLLSDRSGRSKRFSEDFLREFFALLSERLEAGDSVKVKGLGTFKLSHVEPRRSVDVTTGQPMEISGHSKVVFIPAKELAEAVNAPFEAFTAIEISDDADLSLLFSKDEIELQDMHDETPDETETEHFTESESPLPSSANIAYASVSSSIEDKDSLQGARNANRPEEPMGVNSDAPTAPVATVQEEEEPVDRSKEEDAPSPIAQEKAAMVQEEEAPIAESKEEDAPSPMAQEIGAIAQEEEVDSAISEDEEEYDIPVSRKRNWIRILMISLGAAIIALIATFGVWYVFATNDFSNIFKRTVSKADTSPSEGLVVGNSSPTVSQEPEPSFADDTVTDTLSPMEEDVPTVPTAPSDPLVYDTITTTRYLTTMAKAHYGNYNLWPYIYDENKAILGHPDRIRPGTPVVIPRLSKLGIDPTNSDDIEKAKKMGREIYLRYGKKI